ncbi:hypothetical protein B9Z55_015606 [Caenorhabditis nigoni]|nr:hypothetical protein B9Z55_015606 [Caenorhabditis nigoni]
MEKFKLEGPETKNDKPDEESDRPATGDKQLQMSYEENSKLKDKIRELETYLKWYKVKDERRKTEETMEK